MSATLEYFQYVLAPQMLIGLVLGVAVILVALGLTIIFGLLDVINMSHGEFYALGAFIALALGSIGLPFWLLLILVPLVMLPVGYIVERGLIQRVFHTGDRHVTTLLLTFGLGLVLEDTFRLVFGPNPYKPETPIGGGVDVFGIFIPSYRLFLIVIGAVIIAAVAFSASLCSTSMPALLRLEWRWPASPACYWRRSIPSSPPWAAISS